MEALTHCWQESDLEQYSCKALWQMYNVPYLTMHLISPLLFVDPRKLSERETKMFVQKGACIIAVHMVVNWKETKGTTLGESITEQMCPKHAQPWQSVRYCGHSHE